MHGTESAFGGARCRPLPDCDTLIGDVNLLPAFDFSPPLPIAMAGEGRMAYCTAPGDRGAGGFV